MSTERAIHFLQRAANLIVRLTYTIGAGILALMMFLTAVDVCLRYIFNRPILGGVELTEFMMALAVSLALAYTALHKGHVTVDLVITRFPPRAQAVINSITWLLTLGVFALIAWQSIVFAENLRAGQDVSTILHIPLYPFPYVLAGASAIVCLFLIENLLNYLTEVIKGTRWWVWTGLMLVIVLFLVLFAAPVWGEGLMQGVSPLIAGLVGTVFLIVILFSGMPVGVVMALIGFLGMVFVSHIDAGLAMMGTSPQRTIASYTNSIIPLFLLMGAFCFYSGLSRDLYNTAYKWLGRLPGGLAIATVGACTGFAAVSGSSIATASTMGTVAIPEMQRYKYNSALATGCVAAGGTIGILIPPSIVLVIYGIITEQSIGKLFLAGFIPGVLEAVFYIITIYILCNRNPLLGPKGPSSSFLEKIASLKSTWGVLALFILVLGGIYAGVFTPTEAAGVGAFGAFLFALGRRKLSWRAFKNSLDESIGTTGMAFLILIGGVLFGYFLAVSRLPSELAAIVSGLPVSRYVILAGILIIYLFLGAIMSGLAMIILTVPIFFPVIVALGFNPIWFGIIIVRMVEIGQITPPVGINVYIIKGVAKDVPLYTIFRGIVPFLIADIFHVILLIAIPQLSLFLPSLMK